MKQNNDKSKEIKNENRATFNEKDICFHDVRSDPFMVYGLYHYREEPTFRRLPDDIAQRTSAEIRTLAKNTAGGRVRFSTDSPFVAIKALMTDITRFPHMTLAGTSGFDLYEDKSGKGTFIGTFMPPVDIKDGYESIIRFSDCRMRSLTIHFPLYNGVDVLYIGLKSDALIGYGAKYVMERPILYYGSSITQGACASRPGNSYQNIISEKLNCDHINLGFSGSALAEDSIVEYMSTLDFSIFVSDYDHNAPTVKHLKNTHEKMFLTIRNNHPDSPVIFISRPNFEFDIEDSIARRNVINQTFLKALSGGDKNVFFIDGERLFGNENRDACTVDGCHPNDAGLVRMAEVISDVIDPILQRYKNESAI